MSSIYTSTFKNFLSSNCLIFSSNLWKAFLYEKIYTTWDDSVWGFLDPILIYCNMLFYFVLVSSVRFFFKWICVIFRSCLKCRNGGRGAKNNISLLLLRGPELQLSSSPDSHWHNGDCSPALPDHSRIENAAQREDQFRERVLYCHGLFLSGGTFSASQGVW